MVGFLICYNTLIEGRCSLALSRKPIRRDCLTAISGLGKDYALAKNEVSGASKRS